MRGATAGPELRTHVALCIHTRTYGIDRYMLCVRARSRWVDSIHMHRITQKHGFLLNLLAMPVTLGWGWHATPTYIHRP